MKTLITILFAVSIISCTTTRQNHEGLNMKQATGEVGKYHTRAILTNVKRTKLGYKHTFISDKGDSLVRVFNQKLPVDSCYYVRKTRLEK